MQSLLDPPVCEIIPLTILPADAYVSWMDDRVLAALPILLKVMSLAARQRRGRLIRSRQERICRIVYV